MQVSSMATLLSLKLNVWEMIMSQHLHMCRERERERSIRDMLILVTNRPTFSSCTHTHACMHARTHACTHALMHVCAHNHNIHTDTHRGTIATHIRTHTNGTHTYRHTHTQAQHTHKHNTHAQPQHTDMYIHTQP